MDILTQMMAELPLGNAEILSLIATAPRRYKVFTIPKKTPGKFRTIAHPARELKLIQKWIAKRVLKDLPIHSSAMAYRVGISILDNAQKHAASQYLLKMDLKDFFPSIKPSDFLHHCAQHMPDLSSSDKRILTQILFRLNKDSDQLELAIGAPSSPLVSNSIFHALDEQIFAYCESNQITYSRYADDLTFSTSRPTVLSEVPVFVATLLDRAPYPRLKLNTEKTVHTSKKHRRQVTGLVLTAENQVSIGRNKKRAIKALVHCYSLNQLTTEEVTNLRGQLSFIHSVEPTFLNSLKTKYGEALLNKLIKGISE